MSNETKLEVVQKKIQKIFSTPLLSILQGILCLRKTH